MIKYVNRTSLIVLLSMSVCDGCSTLEPGAAPGIARDRDVALQAPTKTPEQTVKDFLCWYNDNSDSLRAIHLVRKHSPGSPAERYAVNFAETEQWLNMLKGSGFVSEAFVLHWRAYFKEAERAFENDPVGDGPAAGFEYDFIYNSQETPPRNLEIQNAILVQDLIEGGKSKVILNITNYGDITKTLMKSSNGDWLLAE